MFSNATKLLASICWLGIVLAINAALFLTNMISLDTGLELLNTEKKPIDHFPVIGPLLKAIAPDATLSNWMALVIAGLMFLGAFWVCHYALKIVRLLFDIRVYRRRNEPENVSAAIDMIGRDLILLGVGIMLMAGLIQGDLYLYTYSRVASAANIDDPVEAASRIGAWWTEAQPELGGAAMWFATTTGRTMYLSASLLAPMLVEHAFTKIGEAWSRCQAALSELWSSASNPDAQVPLELYGYDESGSPVYDPEVPVAYDVDQQPVTLRQPPVEVRSSDAAYGDAPTEGEGGEVIGDRTVAVFPEREDRVLVIGGRPGETIAMVDAISRPTRYHVERATRRVYDLEYWKALHSGSSAHGDSTEAA